ncbi:hypothetical protein TNCV_3192121 [Trichonephila clavipes]|nr:hypothetical protein TNCV_3192121 [Trichonephila clavipes]
MTFSDEPRNFELWSGDEDDTRGGTPSPNYHTNRRMFELSTDLTCITPLHGGLLGYWARTHDKPAPSPLP